MSTDETLSADESKVSGVPGAFINRAVCATATQGVDKGLSITLQKQVVVIGTDSACDLVLTDRTVSRRHIGLHRTLTGVEVEDVGSKNGTYHDGVKFGKLMLFAPARLRLGPHTEIEIHAADEPVMLPEYPHDHFGRALGRSRAMRELFAVLDRAARTDASVLLRGDTGTGKEVLAQAIHAASSRRDGPMRVVDCGALPANLIESELFGHVRGAFTGATENKRGLIEEANGGTLFLDEIGELPLDLQPKLLRVLESREVRPVGDTRPRKVQLRVIAATHRDLPQAIKDERFREDLYYRLAVVSIEVPPLRARKDDLAPLVERFVADAGATSFVLSAELLGRMQIYDWPGNVRELRNFVERCLALGVLAERQGPGAERAQRFKETPAPQQTAVCEAPRSMNEPDMLSLPFKEAKGRLIESFEREYLTHLLGRHRGNISRAADEAGIDRNYIHRMVKKYGLAVQRDG